MNISYILSLIIIMIFILSYIYYLQKKTKEELEVAKYNIQNYKENKLYNYISQLDAEDETILKFYLRSLFKTKEKKREKYELYKTLAEGVIASMITVCLTNLKYPQYTMYPVSSTIVSIIMSNIF